MLLGKRPRPPMSRTISMTEFAANSGLPDGSPMPSDQSIPATIAINPHQHLQHLGSKKQSCFPGDFPPEWFRRNSADLAAATETAPFLRTCGLCERGLSLGRDIFMYRGEIAFCSLECRQQLMNQEERKKNSLSFMKDSAPATAAVSEPSGPGETVAAA